MPLVLIVLCLAGASVAQTTTIDFASTENVCDLGSVISVHSCNDQNCQAGCTELQSIANERCPVKGGWRNQGKPFSFECEGLVQSLSITSYNQGKTQYVQAICCDFQGLSLTCETGASSGYMRGLSADAEGKWTMNLCH